jgi:hypothetical protein
VQTRELLYISVFFFVLFCFPKGNVIFEMIIQMRIFVVYGISCSAINIHGVFGKQSSSKRKTFTDIDRYVNNANLDFSHFSPDNYISSTQTSRRHGNNRANTTRVFFFGAETDFSAYPYVVCAIFRQNLHRKSIFKTPNYTCWQFFRRNFVFEMRIPRSVTQRFY